MKNIYKRLILSLFVLVLITPASYARKKSVKYVALPDWFYNPSEYLGDVYIGVSRTGLSLQEADEDAIAKALFLYTLASEKSKVEQAEGDYQMMRGDSEISRYQQVVKISEDNIGYQVVASSSLESGETVVAIEVTPGSGKVAIDRYIESNNETYSSMLEITYKSSISELQSKWSVSYPEADTPSDARTWDYAEHGFLEESSYSNYDSNNFDMYSNNLKTIATSIGDAWQEMVVSLRIEFFEARFGWIFSGYDSYMDSDSTPVSLEKNTQSSHFVQKISSIAILPRSKVYTIIGADEDNEPMYLVANFKSTLTFDQQLQLGVEIPLADFLKKSIERDIYQWQVKDEFETTAAWRARVNEATRNEKIAELTDTYKQAYYDKYIDKKRSKFKEQKFNLREYDADNQSFLVNCSEDGDIVVPVDIAHAPQFKADWSTLYKSVRPTFKVGGDGLYLSAVEFTHNDIAYTSHLDTYAQYAVADIDYNFAPIQIDDTAGDSERSRVDISSEKVYADVQHSDVNVNIPETSIDNRNTFVLIIANENYDSEKRVDFALNDGRTFREYCRKTLGVPDTNIHIVEDATFGNMTSEIDWFRRVLEQYGERAKAIFYYAGHGIPNESTGSSYLLPTDCANSNFNVAYSLDTLYKELGRAGSSSLTYFIDACFSGAERGGEMMASSRGVAIKAKHGSLYGNSVLFSAASSDQTASAYKEKGHGLFTYFLLKKLQESRGDVDYKELADYIRLNVGDISTVQHKAQTPNIVASPQLGNQWHEWDIVE